MVGIPKGLKFLGRDKDETTTESSRKQERRALAAAEARVSSVLDESAPEAARTLLEKNTRFTLPNNVGWLVLILPVDNIGGLSKRTSRSEEKGSLVQRIGHDDLNVIATPEMLDRETFAFIPNEQTLVSMREFNLLHDGVDENGEVVPKYVWGVIMAQPTEDAELPVKVVRMATLDEAVQIQKGELDLATALPRLTRWARDYVDEESTPLPPLAQLEHDGLDEDQDESTGSTTAVAPAPSSDEDPDDDDDDLDDDDDDSDDEAEDPDEDEDPLADASTSENQDGAVFDESGAVDYNAMDKPGNDLDDDLDEGLNVAPPVPVYDDELLEDGPSEDEWVQHNDGADVDVERVRATIARRFLSGDLDLTVDYEEFEANFGQREVPQLHPSEDLSDWLGEHAAQLIEDANAELASLYEQHQQQLRRQYVDAVSQRIEAAMPELSLEGSDSTYAKLIAAARTDFETAQKDAESAVVARRKELHKEFETNAEEKARAAAEMARVQYKERNQGRYERLIAEAGREVAAGTEDAFEHKRSQVLELRAAHAQKQLDAAATAAMQQIDTVSREFAEAEFQMLQGFTAQINELVTKHAQDDVVRARALREELERDQTVQRLRTEHHQEMDRATERWQQRFDNAARDYAAQQEATLAEMHAAAVRHEQELAGAQRKVETSQEYAVTLEGMLATVREEARADMEETVRNKDRAIESLQAQNESMATAAKVNSLFSHQAGWMLAICIVLVMVVAVAAGWLLHSSFGTTAAMDVVGWVPVGLDTGVALQ